MAAMESKSYEVVRILLDDGAIELRVESVTDTDIVTRVINGGELSQRKGINIPGVPLQIPSLTQKDREDLKWAASQGVDYFALSFVRTADDCCCDHRADRDFGSRLSRLPGHSTAYRKTYTHSCAVNNTNPGDFSNRNTNFYPHRFSNFDANAFYPCCC